MQQKIKVPQGTKDTLNKKTGDVFENVLEKVEEKTTRLKNKIKESDLTLKAKEKLGDLKTDSKKLFTRITEKFPGKK
jgi:hypothetical protein